MKRTLLGLLLFVIIVPLSRVAAEEAPKKQPVGQVAVKALLFGEYWGANRDNLLSVLKDRFDSAWRAKASDLDAYEVDVEIRKSQERYQEVVRSYTELDQNSAAYLASPLKGEFGLGLDQSLLRVKLKHGDRYFLFQSSRVAKIVEVVPAARFKNVDSFSAWQAKAMNLKSILPCTKAPDSNSGEAAGQGMAEMEKALTACVIDKSRLFSAYLLRVNDPSTAWKRSEQKTVDSDDQIGLPDIFTDDPDSEDNRELVDELTGNKKKKVVQKKKPSKLNPRKKAKRKKEKGLSDDEDVLY